MKPTCAAVLVARDEAPYLAEWIAHYATLGFDEIVVYDNASSDETQAVIEAFSGVIGDRLRRVEWPDRLGEAPQRSAYQDVLRTSQHTWLGFFDADEFLVLNRHDSIHDFIAALPENAGAVAFNWKIFGTSGNERYQDAPQTLRFRRCAEPAGWNNNHLFKSMARREAVRNIISHHVELAPDYIYVDGDGEPVKGFHPKNPARLIYVTHDGAQLNHYVLRSREEFETKRRRGNSARPRELDNSATRLGEDFFEQHDRNEGSDTAIDRWLTRSAYLRLKLNRALDGAGLEPGRRGA